MNEQHNEMTVIGRDTRIRGEMEFEGGARVLGHFEGQIRSAGEIQIGEGANCNATVEAARVTVDGNVRGDMAASERLTLNASADVQGDIVAGAMIVSEGATFMGQCRVGTRAFAERADGAQDERHASNGRATPVIRESKPELPRVVDADEGDGFTPPWRANGDADKAENGSFISMVGDDLRRSAQGE